MNKKLVSLSLILLLVCGCAGFSGTASKLLASAALTADKAMQGWATYVVINNILDSDPKTQKVKAAYAKYQLTMAAAQSAYFGAVNATDKSVWSQAAAALTASAADLSALVISFTTPNQPVKI